MRASTMATFSFKVFNCFAQCIFLADNCKIELIDFIFEKTNERGENGLLDVTYDLRPFKIASF